MMVVAVTVVMAIMRTKMSELPDRAAGIPTTEPKYSCLCFAVSLECDS